MSLFVMFPDSPPRRPKIWLWLVAGLLAVAGTLAATADLPLSGSARLEEPQREAPWIRRAGASATILSIPGQVAPRLSWPGWAAWQPARGMLLIAAEKLLDPNFSETVVLLLHYGEEGALGIVINRKSSVTVADVLPEVEEFQTRGDALYSGGPVAVNTVMMLALSPRQIPESTRVLEGVYAVNQVERLRGLLEEGLPVSSLRVFAGHAGWSPGQLESEIARRDWFLRPASSDWVFNANPESIWSELIRLAGLQVARGGRAGH